MDVQTMDLLPLDTPPSATAGFDYSQLNDAAANQAKAAVDRYRDRQMAYVIETGRDLLAIKAQLEHGLFLEWVQAEMGMTPRSAQRAMSAAEVLGDKSDTVSYLPPSVLYELSAPSTPEQVRAAVLRRIEAGETVRPEKILHDVRQGRDQARQHIAAEKERTRRAALSQEERDEEDALRGKGEKRQAAATRKQERERVAREDEQRRKDAIIAEGAVALVDMIGADRVAKFFARFGNLSDAAFQEAEREAHRQRAQAVEPTEISINDVWRIGSLYGWLAPVDRPRVEALARDIERDGLCEYPVVLRDSRNRVHPYRVLSDHDTVRALTDVLGRQNFPVRIAPPVTTAPADGSDG
ncbi:hypothetical protein MKK69_21970 [Methylobacterium sp. J-026]|uniref:hypothetical protein n=1 Tax=Methylobacterium sp. J-026 TaxID=2836624 RepID=UPI001FBBD6A0|nr:hypothetical protein [Methylobacterium sp. J-026]MCJ2136682.1 hypothetical protein [Methylobacterium sp. J-026]